MIKIYEAIILRVLCHYEMPFDLMKDHTLQALRKLLPLTFFFITVRNLK